MLVIACGAWSPRIAKMAGASIPLTPMVHQMIDIGPAPRFADTKAMIEYPIVRDMDTNMYERQEGTGLEIGSYAHRPITLDADEIPSIEESALTPTELPFTQEDFDPQMEIALDLMPEIVGDESVGVKYAINGVLSVTYDGMPLLGETPEVRGLWSAAAIWIKEGPGAGKTVAELMVNGESEIDVFESNVARAYPCQRTRRHVTARASEGFNKMYGIVHPVEQWESDRKVRLSPFYDRELELGAVFYEAAGWERPQWYQSNRMLLDQYADRIVRREAEWDARWWSPIINAEHLAMRDRCAMVDLTAFTVFDVTGPGALDAVQRLAMRQMDVAVGRVVYTPILTPSGGFKQDLTIMRIGDDVFRVVTGGALRDVRQEVVRRPPPRGRLRAALRPDQLVVHARPVGAAGARRAPQHHERRRLARGVPVRALQEHRGRPARGAGLADLLRRRSRLGALRADRAGRAALGHRRRGRGARTGSCPPESACTAPPAGSRSATARTAPSSTRDYNVVEAGMAWGKVKDQDFIGKEAHVRHREEEPAAILCTLTVDDHTPTATASSATCSAASRCSLATASR